MFAPEEDDFLEDDDSAFGKSGGLFGGTGARFDDDVTEDLAGESPRTNDLEASVRSNKSGQCLCGCVGGVFFYVT